MMTMALRGLPHFALTLSALSSFRKDASLLKDETLSLKGLNVGTDSLAGLYQRLCSHHQELMPDLGLHATWMVETI